MLFVKEAEGLRVEVILKSGKTLEGELGDSRLVDQVKVGPWAVALDEVAAYRVTEANDYNVLDSIA